MKVAFILSKFPCYDEVFLLREIQAVAQRLPVTIVSLRRSREPVIHDEARDLLGRTFSPPYLLSLELLGAHLSLLARRPLRYVKALATTIGGNLKSPQFLAKNLLLFPKAVLVARWAEREGVTHVHAGWATYPASVALVVSELTDIPFSFSGHAHDLYLDTTHLATKLRRARHVTTCTESNREFLRALAPDVPSSAVQVVRHGLHLSSYRRGPRTPEGGLQILSVGTLFPHKGFFTLLDGLEHLVREGRRFHCTIVGGGPQEDELRRRAEQPGLSGHVTIAGALPHSEVIPHYERSDVFVLMAQPEWHWGVPNVIVEALAARNAVITTRFGSVEELVEEGQTGLLVPPRDPQTLATAVERLASDEDLRARLAEAGHVRVVDDYDIRRTAELYVRCFESSGRGTRAPAVVAPEGS